MFFVASKLFWIVASPASLVALALVAGLAALAAGRARAARVLLGVGVGVYLLCAFGPLEGLLARPLEDRFPRPAADAAAPDGIIVLGGGMDETVSEARHALVLGEYGSRMSEAVALARRYPTARMIFTGGNGDLVAHATSEADVARRFFEALGVAAGRFQYEDRSRNTDENARFTRDLVRPKPGERFFLVTSGFHMPRAIGVFRKAGFNVVGWPADYMMGGSQSDFWRPRLDPAQSLARVDTAAREWIGLLAYRLTGKTDTLLPAP